MSSATHRWRRLPVREIATAIFGGSTPSRDVPSLWNGGISWVTPGELTKLRGKYLHKTAETISKAGLANSGAKLLPADTLIVTTRATLGLVALTTGPMTTNQGFKSIVLSDGADPNFYYHLFKTLKPEMERRASGTTFLEISGKQFGEIVVPLPPIREQRRIAEILDTLDAQIQATKQVIGKLAVWKRGLIESLLVRDTHKSKLKVVLFGNPGNGIYKPASMIGQGSLLVGQTAFTKDRLVDTSLARRAVVTDNELNRFGLHVDDILVSRVFATLDGVGQPALVQQLNEPAVFESNMMRLRCNPTKADAFFVFESLQTSHARAYIVQHAKLSNQASISQDVLTELPLWLPNLDEQRRISSRLRAADARREAEERLLRKLEAIKHGLMPDLLTGRLRVQLETA
jgi:type I restriction enzyme S subunit